MKSTASAVLAILLGLPLFAGCKTAASSLKDSSDSMGTSSLHCSFDSPVGSDELFEVWATPSNDSLQGVKQRYVSAKGARGQMQEIGTAAPVGMDVMTQGGKRGLRAYLKDLVNINLKKFNCFALETGAKQTFMCMQKQADETGGRPALLVTNAASQKFTQALTVYRSTCAAK